MKKYTISILAFLFCTSCSYFAPSVDEIKSNKIIKCDPNAPIENCISFGDDSLQEKDTIHFLKSPEKIEKLGLFKNLENIYDGYAENDDETQYYKVGNFEFKGKKGEIFLVSSIEIYSPSKFYFAKFENTFYVLKNISTDFSGEPIKEFAEIFTEKVQKNIDEKLEKFLEKNLFLPKKISFEKDGKKYTLRLRENLDTFFEETNLEKIEFLEDKNGGNFYIETRKSHTWGSDFYKKYKKMHDEDFEKFEKLEKKIKEKYNKEKLKISIFSNKGIYKKMPDGTTAIYSLDLPFEKEKMKKSKEGYEEKITYLDIKIPEYKKEIQWYHSEENNGCGVRKYALDFQGKFIVSVLDGDKKKDEILTYKNEDLKVIGETGSGEKVYGFADKNHPFLQKLHKAHIAAMSMFGDDGYDEKGKKKWMDYEDFIKELPIFFWDDPFGRRVAFVKSQTVMRFGLSCGAKPVIYLYPEKKQKISVTLDWKKRNLISIPTYKNKWEVMVKPNGNIEFEGKNYPYLFWEDGLFLKKKEDGFIVKKENMDLFLGEKLQILGLNQKEIAYFKEFWLDKMLEKPYYFVRFYTNEDMNFSAPITIIPKPDSIQRVFIDYKGLNEEIEIEEQELKPFRRKGFSVIEWGGNLQK